MLPSALDGMKIVQLQLDATYVDLEFQMRKIKKT